MQPENNLRVAVARKVSGDQGGVLGDADQPFLEPSNLPEHVSRTVGRLLLPLAAGKEIVHLFQDAHVPEVFRLALAQPWQALPRRRW